MSLSIAEVRVSHYHLPREAWWSVPLEDRTIAIDAIDLITCELTTREGATGLGYTYTLSHGGSGVARLLADEIAPLLAGERIDRPEPLWHRAWERMTRYGRGGSASIALSAADVALWDVLARAADLPLYRYLGAHRESVPVYGSSIDLGYDLDGLLDVARDWLAQGIDAVKIKVGRPLQEDLTRLAAVRELVGPRVELMVDANNGWDLPEAGRRIRAMEEFELTWVEEPLHPDHSDAHAALQRGTSIPIAAGETLFSVADFLRYFQSGAIRYVQADIGRVGGITPWLDVARIAAAFGLPMAPHFLHDLHVHLICAVPNAYRLEYLPLLDEVMRFPLQLVDGHAVPPPRPGHGVEFDIERIAPYQVTTHVVAA